MQTNRDPFFSWWAASNGGDTYQIFYDTSTVHIRPANRAFTLTGTEPQGIVLKTGNTVISPGSPRSFGPALELGEEATVNFTLTNIGDTPVTGIVVDLPQGGSDFRIGTPPPATTLAVGASTSFDVIFAPQALGNRNGILRVVSSANPSPYSISVTGIAASPPAMAVPAKDAYGFCDTAASDIAAFLASHGGAQISGSPNSVTWTNDYNGILPACEGFIPVTFTATDANGLTVSSTARFFLLPPGSIWIGAAASSWTTAAGWHPQIPSATRDVYVDLFDFQDTVLSLTANRIAKNLFIGEGDTLAIDGGNGWLHVLGNSIRNDGQLTIERGRLSINGATSLSGTGRIVLSGDGANVIDRESGTVADVLTVGAGQEITTTAETVANYQFTSIHAGIVNHGTITADTGGLNLFASPKTNRATMRAINGGTLLMQALLDNEGGTLTAGADSALHLNTTLSGGTVDGTGSLRVTSTGVIAGPIRLASGLTTALEGGNTYLSGAVTNEGRIVMGLPGGSSAMLWLDGPVTLGGAGKLVLQDAGNRQILSRNSTPADLLTVGTEQEVITTAGTIAEYQNAAIHASVLNHGTITADTGGLVLFQYPKTNRGTLRAINGGILRIQATVDNTQGNVFVGPGSTLWLGNTLTGGALTGTGRVLVNSTAGLTGPVSLGSGLTTALEGGNTYFSGAITNDGRILIGRPDVTAAVLWVDGAVTLGGTGKLVLQDAGNRQILSRNSTASDVLTVGAAQEITTNAGTMAEYQSAAIYTALVNQGTVSADIGGLMLFLHPKTNNGLFRAIRGGTLLITSPLTNYNATTDTLTGGRWEVVSESTATTLDIPNSPILTIGVGTHVRLTGAAASFPQLSGLTTVAGTLAVEKGKVFTTAGSLTVTGRLEFGLGDGNLQGFDSQRLFINGNVDFTGSFIDVMSFGTTPGLYEVARWTGTATGIPTLGNVPAGLSYELVFSPGGKTLHVQVSTAAGGGGLKILSVRHHQPSGTTTIEYISEAGISHTVRGTRDFVTYDTLPATVTGTGGVLEYVHPNAVAPAKYFYIFETGP